MMEQQSLPMQKQMRREAFYMPRVHQIKETKSPGVSS